MSRVEKDEIYDRYLTRAISEINELGDEIARCAVAPAEAHQPVIGSGHPLADIFLLKYAGAAPDDEELKESCPAWLLRELAIVQPKMVVVMGPDTLEFVNDLDLPLGRTIEPDLGEIQKLTPTIEALYVPAIEESLDEQGAKRRFWDAFRSLGSWYEALPPY